MTKLLAALGLLGGLWASNVTATIVSYDVAVRSGGWVLVNDGPTPFGVASQPSFSGTLQVDNTKTGDAGLVAFNMVTGTQTWTESLLMASGTGGYMPNQFRYDSGGNLMQFNLRFKAGFDSMDISSSVSSNSVMGLTDETRGDPIRPGGVPLLIDRLEMFCNGCVSFAPKPPPPLSYTIDQIVQDAVSLSVTSDQQGITGSFTPNFGLTLDEAAAIGGYNHFNWVQTVVSYPGGFCRIPIVNAPFIDPPQGGCTLPRVNADNLPFYWDEGLAGADPGYLLEDNISLGAGGKRISLDFVDYPQDIFVIPGVNSMDFHTYLAGVRTDGTYDLLGDVQAWSSDFNALLGTGGITRNIVPFPEGVGGVFGLRTIGLGDILSAERALLVESGAANVFSVPEPSSLSLILAGVYGLAFTQRRRKKQ